MPEQTYEQPYKEYGQSWEIAAALWDGPRTLPEIVDHFHSYVRLLGFFNVTRRMARRHGTMAARIEAMLDALIARGWIVREGQRYALTAEGREEARKPLADMRRNRAKLQTLAQPETVSKVGLGVHLALAALKLPAALLSGSVGLLNDATDTLLDGLSSVLVYLGLRFDRERAANGVLVLLMLGTGGLTCYEAVRRLLVPVAPDVDAFTFVATLLSALVCWGLYLYQRFVGVRSGSLALITQSVDSRNHVIVAASVTVGLIASRLDFPLLDTLVGLAVAGLILQSAIELVVETVRSLGEADADLSRYEMHVAEWYARFRETQMHDWILYLIAKEGVRTRAAVRDRVGEILDVSDNPMLRELGVTSTPDVNATVAPRLAELRDEGWLAEAEPLTLTEAGRAHLARQMRAGTRGHLRSRKRKD